MLSTMPELLSFTPAFINLGVPELSIIVLLVLIFFGPGKLPSIMKSLGDGVKQFKDASNGGATAHPNSTDNPDTKHLS
jgi:sec-independent protein translocase protein TatA